MQPVHVIKFTSKLGLVVMLLGIGLALSGGMGLLLGEEAANKATAIGGLVLGAVGFVLMAMENVLMEDF